MFNLKTLYAGAVVAALTFTPVLADEEKSVTVYKTPWCGCCHVWAEEVAKAGYSVKVHDMEDLTSIKKQAGVPEDMQACHTAVVGKTRKYVLEGHVPLQAMDKLMSERPDIHGLAVAGMPMGSLGMDYDPNAEYLVHALPQKRGEAPTVYMRMGEAE
ncbi:DUF411 domain-containing protein [Labrenzia sp. PHM005]|uniref:DUF411 domain-containing protein n=1 Tax=Labrenzia sp. PHM005 TaxID=2590016 RepID=UPI0011404EEE|nr:DUF411 domain-containing protein [Labrenzia sp. PHM005]QDG78978.1 DUF411 domain-containing protein [Labrenzia sp. PHM005]